MNVLDYFIQSQVILLSFYVLYITILHRKIAYGFSRVYLLIIAPLSLILPLLKVSLGVRSSEFYVSYLPEIFVVTGDNSSMISSLDSFTFPNFLLGCFELIYCVGFLFFIVILCVRIVKSAEIFKKGKILETNGIKIIISPNGRGAFSLFGKIVIGENCLKNPNILHIIKHEESHCNLSHSADMVFISVQKALLWFNPLMWHAEALLKEIHEYQADASVVKLGVDPLQYSGLLIDFERQGTEPYLANQLSYLSLKRRILMIGEVGKKKSNVRVLLALPILLIFTMLFCITPTGCDDNLDKTLVKEGVESNGIANIDEKSAAAKEYPFAICPVKPTFRGGDQNEFTRWVFQQINYPEDAKENGIQGRVTLQFSVNVNGAVSDVRVIRGVHESLDKESLRVISASPRWEPGRDEDGNPIKVRFTFPVIFQLR